LHYEAYNKEFKNYDKELSYFDYLDILNKKGMDKYLTETFPIEKDKIKKNKNANLHSIEKIEVIKNADTFISYIEKYSINHVVVTNTSAENVKFFKDKVPVLNKLKNWVVRENYTSPKPNSECYDFAKEMFYKNEKYIIGIENSIAGYESIKNITDCVYIVTNKNDKQYNYFKKNDVYLMQDFLSIFN
jgi:beta-phosphoglucomutase-like phosphatase (HAD superfamily)